MPGDIYDRVCETTTTTGTGTLTLGGAVPGFLSFGGAGVSVSVSYLIEAVDASGVPTGEWEAGIGTLTGVGSTFSRDVVTASSDFGSPVSFAAGTKRVHLSVNASDLILTGVTCSLTSGLTAQNFTTAAAIPWHSFLWSSNPRGTGFYHDSGVNPSRITLPSGFDASMVRLHGQVAVTGVAAPDWAEIKIIQNGASTPLGRSHAAVTSANNVVLPVVSRSIYANSTDYFELFLQIGTDTSVDLTSYETWLELEVLQ